MAYTANEHIAIAVADRPVGPFKQQVLAPLDAPVKIIDPFVWIDPSGTIYLFHVRLENGNRIFVAEMDSSLTAMNETTLRECINATDEWEDTQGTMESNRRANRIKTQRLVLYDLFCQ